MLKKVFPLVAATLILSGPLYAECMKPEKEATVPDGSSATMDEMVAAQTEVNAYLKNAQEYLDCRSEEMDAMADDVTDKQKVANTENYNAYVDKVTSVGEAWNAALKAYKKANQ